MPMALGGVGCGLAFRHPRGAGIKTPAHRLDEAFEHYREALAIDEVQLNAHPDNIKLRFFITYTYNDTGLILKKRGDLDGALAYYGKSLDIRSAMVAAEPKTLVLNGALPIRRSILPTLCASIQCRLSPSPLQKCSPALSNANMQVT